MIRFLSLLAAAAGTVALAACGGSRSAGPTGPPPSATGNQINPMPRDKVQDGGKLVWPIDNMPPQFNYNQLDGTDENTAFVLGALMPGMFQTDPSGTPQWDPNYLASEPVVTRDPKQIITYEINPKAVWSDGTPITWTDFYWQWKASSGTDKAYQISAAQGYEDIESVAKGKDDREVIVTFKHHYADWQAIFGPLYSASTNKSPTIFNEGWKTTLLQTAGPFRLDHIDQTAKIITLVRNEKWWGDRPKLDSIVYRIIEPDAQIDALANGEIDLMDVGPDANKYHRAKAIAGIDMRVAGGPNFRHITINGTTPILSDLKVRQAFALAIDRAAIARALLGPLDVAATPLNNHIFMANQAGYQDNSGDVGRYDPAKGKQLLDDAGWKLDGAVRKKNGSPLEITAVIPAGVATSRQETELMQNMLNQVGMTLKINTVPTADFFDKYLRPGQFDVTVFSWMGTPYPVSSAKSIYVMPTKDARGEMAIQQNFARIGSPQIDGLFLEAAQELDRVKAQAIANQIDALIWQEVHSLTMYQRPEIYACKKALANFGAFGFAQGPTAPMRDYQNIGWAKP